MSPPAVFVLRPGGVPLLCAVVETRDQRPDRERRRETGSRLVRTLWPLFSSIKRPAWDREADPGIPEITMDSLGRPWLALKGRQVASVSFSHCSGTTWATIAPAESRCGIDAATAEEFHGAYPYRRAFEEGELKSALCHTCQSRPHAAALLWSAKEATVKALGCGFRFMDPLQVRIAELTDSGSTINAFAELPIEIAEKYSMASTFAAVNILRWAAFRVSAAMVQGRATLPGSGVCDASL